MSASDYDGRRPEPPYDVRLDDEMQAEIDRLQSALDAANAELSRLRSSPAPVVGGVPEPLAWMHRRILPGNQVYLFVLASEDEVRAATAQHGGETIPLYPASRLPALNPGEVGVNQSHLGTLYERIAWISCQLQVGYSAKIAASELADLLDAPCFADRRAQPTTTEKETDHVKS